MEKNNSLFQSKDLIVYVIKHLKTFTIVGVAAVVLSAIFSGPYFIKPKYKSVATIFASTTPSISQALTVEDNPYRKNVMEFGEEEEAEQLIQVLQSDRIKNAVVKEFNLGQHYGLDPNHDEYLKTIDFMYGQNFKFKKTEYLAIDVTVLDFDADTAAIMANRIVELVDAVNLEIRQKRAKEALVILEEYYNQTEKQIDSLYEKVDGLNKEGLISLELQVERLTEQYAIALRNGNKRGADLLKKEIERYGQKSANWYKYDESIELLHENLELTRVQLNNMRVDNKHSMKASFVINKAVPALKKHTPIRWLIVLATLMLSLITTMVILYFSKEIKAIKNEI
ncbi:MAG: Wzz/FepE/Etk N-terminal domain-containing protein [Flavobacteriales bacterium]